MNCGTGPANLVTTRNPSRDHMIIDLWKSTTEELYRTIMNCDTGPANLVTTRNPSREHMMIDSWKSMTEERYRTMMNYDTGPANLVTTRNPSRDHMIIDLWKSITKERYRTMMNYHTGPANLVTTRNPSRGHMMRTIQIYDELWHWSSQPSDNTQSFQRPHDDRLLKIHHRRTIYRTMMNYDTGPANLVTTRTSSRDHMIIDLWQSITEERYRTMMNYDTDPANLVATSNGFQRPHDHRLMKVHHRRTI